jgi:release factor glutamine methyltransferase
VTSTAKALLQWGLEQLSPIVDNADTDARILLAHALGIDRGFLAARLQDVVSPEQTATYQRAIAQRCKRQPVSQIIGYREFWGRNFKVTPDVLDPRPDTETLIETVLKGEPAADILDLGTGSGCILLTLLSEWSAAQGQGVDSSAQALQVAGMNAQQLGLTARCSLKKSIWFSNVTGKFDLIVSNPPYITAKEMHDLAPEVREWEPRSALTPEGDGLDAYRIIAAHAGRFLAPKGRLFLEIGWDQAKAVLQILSDAGLSGGYCVQDLNGKDRVIGFHAANLA